MGLVQQRDAGGSRRAVGLALALTVVQLAGLPAGSTAAHVAREDAAAPRLTSDVRWLLQQQRFLRQERQHDEYEQQRLAVEREEEDEQTSGGEFFALQEDAPRLLQEEESATPAPVGDGGDGGTASPTGQGEGDDDGDDVDDVDGGDEDDDEDGDDGDLSVDGTPAPVEGSSEESTEEESTTVTTGTPSPVADGSEGTASPTSSSGSEGFTPTPVEMTGTAAPYAPSECSIGIAGVGSDNVCCLEACGVCGGEGCGTIAGTNGASDCCPSTIIEESGGAFCGEAPCVMDGFTPSPVNPAFDGSAAPVAPSTCSNGVPGYQDGDICCLEACGQCGGDGCGTIAGSGGSTNCCPTTIRESEVVCGQAPCIIEGYTPAPVTVGGGTAAPFDASSTCSNGFAGFQDGAVCCAANCGQCGGLGCGAVPGTGGSSACCSSIVEVEGESCDVALEAPCIIQGYTPAPVVPDYGSSAPVVPSTCSNGMAGYQDLDVCCLEACGQCGGAGCGTVAGTGGSNFCCSSSVRETGEMCGNGVEAPCIIPGFTPSPVNPAFDGTASPVVPSTCSNGLAGVQNGAACCLESCGQCGGVGCGAIPGTGGSTNCCASTVLETNAICGNGVEAPCVINNYTPAPAGVPGDAAPFATSTCSNGFSGVQNDNICCAENCGQCGGAGCGTLPGTGGSGFCCSTTVATNGTDCQSAGSAPCIINDWVPTPAPVILETAAPVLPSTCSNGLDGYQDGNVCCKMSCGLCGGDGCGKVNGTAGSSDCCPTTIALTNQVCGGQVVAPCVIPITSAPTMAPAITPKPTPTPFTSGNANDFINSTTNAADSRVQGPVGILPFVASLAAFFGALAFSAHHSVRSGVE